MALVEDRIAFFNLAGEVRIVRILAGNVGIDIVNRMRPRIACQHQTSDG